MGKLEVVEVAFDPKVTSYEALLKAARCVKNPSKAFTYRRSDFAVAKRIVGADAVLTKKPSRPAKASDQWYYLRRQPHWYLPLTPTQAARLNGVFGTKGSQGAAARWLTPSQRKLLAEIRSLPASKAKALAKLRPARDPAAFASYRGKLAAVVAAAKRPK